MSLTKDITKRLSGFFNWYGQKVDFLKDLSHKQKSADEIILLVCCYLEQLGNCLFPKTGSSKRSFEHILSTHSGENEEFSLISVADLAYDIFYVAESISYTIPKPGRIQFQSDDIKPLIKFIDQTGIALTQKSVHKLFSAIYANLVSNFRIYPYQTARKNSYGARDDVINLIISNPKLKHMGAEIKENNVKDLIEEYTYTSILYREYRCKAVHEAVGVYLDTKKFWKNKRPYFGEAKSHLLQHPIFKLEFPISFLIECLETCVECAEKAIKGKGSLPPAIWNAICTLDEIEFMDFEGIEETKQVRLRIE